MEAVRVHAVRYKRRLKAGELVDQELYDKLVNEAVRDKLNGATGWTLQEQCDFLDYVKKYGRNFKIISELMRTRNYTSCRWFGEKIRYRLKKGQNPFALDPILKEKMTPDLIYRLLVENTKERNRQVDLQEQSIKYDLKQFESILTGVGMPTKDSPLKDLRSDDPTQESSNPQDSNVKVRAKKRSKRLVVMAPKPCKRLMLSYGRSLIIKKEDQRSQVKDVSSDIEEEGQNKTNSQ